MLRGYLQRGCVALCVLQHWLWRGDTQGVFCQLGQYESCTRQNCHVRLLPGEMGWCWPNKIRRPGRSTQLRGWVPQSGGRSWDQQGQRHEYVLLRPSAGYDRGGVVLHRLSEIWRWQRVWTGWLWKVLVAFSSTRWICVLDCVAINAMLCLLCYLFPVLHINRILNEICFKAVQPSPILSASVSALCLLPDCSPCCASFCQLPKRAGELAKSDLRGKARINKNWLALIGWP